MKKLQGMTKNLCCTCLSNNTAVAPKAKTGLHFLLVKHIFSPLSLAEKKKIYILLGVRQNELVAHLQYDYNDETIFLYNFLVNWLFFQHWVYKLMSNETTWKQTLKQANKLKQ